MVKFGVVENPIIKQGEFGVLRDEFISDTLKQVSNEFPALDVLCIVDNFASEFQREKVSNYVGNQPLSF